MESKGTTDPSVQAVLQNLRLWSSESVENFEKMHQRSVEWLRTSVSNTATMFSLQPSNKPLPTPSILSASIPVPVPPKMSLSLAVTNSKMKPEKRPQLKLSAMDFTQIDDEELPTAKSKPEVPTRKRSLGSPRKSTPRLSRSTSGLSELVEDDAKKSEVQEEQVPIKESRKSNPVVTQDARNSYLFGQEILKEATPSPFALEAENPVPTLSPSEYDEMTESMSIIEDSPVKVAPVPEKIAPSRKKSSVGTAIPCIARPRKSSTSFPARQILCNSPEPGTSDADLCSLDPDSASIVVVSAPCAPLESLPPKMAELAKPKKSMTNDEPGAIMSPHTRSPESVLMPQIKHQEAQKPVVPVELDPFQDEEPGLLITPDPPMPISTQPRFSSPFATSNPGAGSPFASQLTKFSSPEFSPISHVAESPLESLETQDPENSSFETKPVVKRTALTRNAKALEEKAKEALKMKETVDKKPKVTRDELAKQRRVEAERKRKLLEEEELKKKQLKVEERAKKMETFEKKKTMQHQEQKKLKEDKRTTVKEKAEALKKTTVVHKEEKEEAKKPLIMKPLALKRPILQPLAPTSTTTSQNDGLMSPPPNRPPRILRASPENVFQLVKKQVIISPRQNHDEDNYEMSDYREDEDDESSDAAAPKKPIPAWARGAMLSRALEAQNLDPDEIFHPMEAQACDLSAIFENFKKKRRFQHRSSSGNWLHDRLHWKEEQAYKQKMGFQSRP